jgi:hypothetical protein
MQPAFIVLRNGNVEAVFGTKAQAEVFIKTYGGWNTWKIIEKVMINSVDA